MPKCKATLNVIERVLLPSRIKLGERLFGIRLPTIAMRQRSNCGQVSSRALDSVVRNCSNGLLDGVLRQMSSATRQIDRRRTSRKRTQFRSIGTRNTHVHAYNRCYCSISDGSVKSARFDPFPGFKRSLPYNESAASRNTFSIIVSFRNEFEENDSGSFYGSVEHNSSYHDFAEICAARSTSRQENLDKSHCSRPPVYHRSKTILQCTQLDLRKYVCVR